MSDRTDAVERAVDAEWRTTREIVERAGLSPGIPSMQCASRKLARLARQHIIER